MSEGTADSPGSLAVSTLRGAWNTALTVYYANSLAWRALKAGALFFFGFFLWAGSNVLYSYRPEWTVLRYTMAYGFLLVGYGPFHHLVVIPLYQRLRRQGTHLSLGAHLHLPNAGLALFLAAVVVLGTVAPAAMTIDLRGELSGSGVDIDPTLQCVRSTGSNATIHCHLSESSGVSSVVVASGRRTLVVDDEPPFEFSVAVANLSETQGGKRFRVELRDADGSLLRQYTRTVSMVPEG